MIEEGGNKRKTMAEKRQLFIEMRECPGSHTWNTVGFVVIFIK
jgi:hypothetical protein